MNVKIWQWLFYLDEWLLITWYFLFILSSIWWNGWLMPLIQLELMAMAIACLFFWILPMCGVWFAITIIILINDYSHRVDMIFCFVPSIFFCWWCCYYYPWTITWLSYVWLFKAIYILNQTRSNCHWHSNSLILFVLISVDNLNK